VNDERKMDWSQQCNFRCQECTVKNICSESNNFSEYECTGYFDPIPETIDPWEEEQTMTERICPKCGSISSSDSCPRCWEIEGRTEPTIILDDEYSE